MKKIVLIFGLLTGIIACNKIEPINIVETKRAINTETLQKYKSLSELQKRNIVMGMLYNWGKESGAFLVNTPDSLDVVVIKDGYENFSDVLKNDLQTVRKEKATKVLVGIDFEKIYKDYETKKEKEIASQKAEKEKEWTISNERLTEEEKRKILSKLEQDIINRYSAEAKQNLDKQAKELLSIAKENDFDGISIEFPQKFNEVYSIENFDMFLAQVVSGKSNLLLSIENPYGNGRTKNNNPIDAVNWIVYRYKGQQLLKNFDEQAEKWSAFRYLPSVDFTDEDLNEGFTDTPIFAPGSRLPRTIDVLNWTAINKGGVAYYHIEKNYYDKLGTVTFKTLRNAIGKQQKEK